MDGGTLVWAAAGYFLQLIQSVLLYHALYAGRYSQHGRTALRLEQMNEAGFNFLRFPGSVDKRKKVGEKTTIDQV